MNILTPTVYGDSVFTSAYGGRTRLFEIAAVDGKFEVDTAWENRAQGYMTSPVVVGHHAYVFLRSNRFTCIDLDSGETAWISPPTGDNYWSLVAQGDRILALSDGGELYLLRANPERFEVLDRLTVAESETWAHLAVDGEQVFVRELGGLAAHSWR
jgi:outer membrane protein assembly factor BamB